MSWKAMYTAEAKAIAGRAGRVWAQDGHLDLALDEQAWDGYFTKD